jgi:hypothetical protein
VAKWQTLFDAIFVGGIHHGGAAEGAPAFGAFALAQVPPASRRPQYFAGASDFEPLGHRFLGFDTFWTSHKSQLSFFKKERAI